VAGGGRVRAAGGDDVLRPACRRFRADVTAEADHRTICPACAAWASAMERAAVRLPLPVSLRRVLRSIPTIPSIETQLGVPGPRRLPNLPVPASLQERLRAIAGPGPARAERPLPAWLRSSRHAVAASLLIALLAVRILGDPLAVGRRAVDSAAMRWRGLESRVTVSYGETRSSLTHSLTDLSSRAISIQASIQASARALVPESIPPSFRRSR